MRVEHIGEGEPELAILGAVHGDELCGVHAIVDESGPLAETICPQLSVAAVVEAADEFPHALVHHVDVVEVECGLQGTKQAAANAEQLVWEFLAATGALPDRSELSERVLPVLSLTSLIPKPDGGSYEVCVENFERVEKETVVATVDGEEVTAEESCYPVLLSEHGYDQRFGYTAELIDRW